MLQVNLLLPLAGRAMNSFVMNDLMRLPLGILSGMGFIGGGAIVRRGNMVAGVTTAATLWFLTVLGLCFGGGQIALGAVGTGIGISALTGLKFLENRMKQDREGKLIVVAGIMGPGEDEIRAILQTGGFQISSCAFALEPGADRRELSCDLHWQAKPYDTKVPEAVARHAGALSTACCASPGHPSRSRAVTLRHDTRHDKR